MLDLPVSDIKGLNMKQKEEFFKTMKRVKNTQGIIETNTFFAIKLSPETSRSM